jgi:hypothetical protein
MNLLLCILERAKSKSVHKDDLLLKNVAEPKTQMLFDSQSDPVIVLTALRDTKFTKCKVLTKWTQLVKLSLEMRLHRCLAVLGQTAP